MWHGEHSNEAQIFFSIPLYELSFFCSQLFLYLEYNCSKGKRMLVCIKNVWYLEHQPYIIDDMIIIMSDKKKKDIAEYGNRTKDPKFTRSTYWASQKCNICLHWQSSGESTQNYLRASTTHLIARLYRKPLRCFIHTLKQLLLLTSYGTWFAASFESSGSVAI